MPSQEQTWSQHPRRVRSIFPAPNLDWSWIPVETAALWKKMLITTIWLKTKTKLHLRYWSLNFISFRATDWLFVWSSARYKMQVADLCSACLVLNSYLPKNSMLVRIAFLQAGVATSIAFLSELSFNSAKTRTRSTASELSSDARWNSLTWTDALEIKLKNETKTPFLTSKPSLRHPHNGRSFRWGNKSNERLRSGSRRTSRPWYTAKTKSIT